MAFVDETLVCKDCGKEFIFSAGEQEFYAEKGFENKPVRCRDCRDKRRRNREGGELSVARRPRFHLSRRTTVLYIAATASRQGRTADKYWLCAAGIIASLCVHN